LPSPGVLVNGSKSWNFLSSGTTGFPGEIENYSYVRIADKSTYPNQGNSTLYFANNSNSDVLTIQVTNHVNDSTINRAIIWARPGNNNAQIRDILVGTDGGSVILRSTGDNASTKDWTFGRTGTLAFPDASIQTTAYTGLIANGTKASDATGTAGQTSYDSTYFYICIATNTWRRVALGSTY
jgi:hypothetical protein